MNDIHTEPRASNYWKRRRFLQATAGAGILPFSEAVNAQSSNSTSGGDEIWRTPVSGQPVAGPTVVGGTVYVGTSDGAVHALDASNGDKQWEFSTGGQVESAPAVVDGTVFVGSTDANLYALDVGDGTQQWRLETGGEVRSSPSVVNGTIYLVSGYSAEEYFFRVYAINAADGTVQWQDEFAGSGDISPTVIDETLYVVSGGGGVYAVDTSMDPSQSEEIPGWRTSYAPVSSPPTVLNGTVFVGNNDNNLYALDTSMATPVGSPDEENGVRWSFSTGRSVVSPPTADNGTVFFGSDKVYAVDINNGTKQWQFSTDSINYGPTVVNDRVIVGDHTLHSLDSTTGDEIWKKDLDIISHPLVVDGTVYVGGADGYVYALDAGISGSSSGSRARLGTLGHHDDWRYAEQTIDINPNASPSSIQDFHPGEHGFGFDNWSGTKSWSVDGQDLQYDPADVSEENVRQLVEEVWPSEYGEALLEPVVKYVYTQFNRGTLTNGHCYGMIHAAIEYFEDPSALPEAADSASNVPYPVGQYEAVGDDIRYYHQSQFFDSASSSSVLQEWGDFKSWVFSILLPGFADVDLTAEIEELRNAIDEYGFAPISLADPGNDDYHQVLGYDYEVAGNETTVFTYDPNESEGYYVDESVEFYRLEVDENGSPTMEYYFNNNLEPYSQFVSMSDVQRDADLREVAAGAVITALIGAAESVKPYLQAASQVGKQQIRLMFAGLHSPAHLEVTGPDEATIIHPDRSEINESMEYTGVVFIFGAPTGDYSYEVVGEGEGEYTLEMVGASQDEVLVSEEVEGEITEGERHNVNVMIPDTGDAEISLDKEGNSSESGLVDIETVAGGGAVTAGLLYLAYRMKRDETEPK